MSDNLRLEDFGEDKGSFKPVELVGIEKILAKYYARFEKLVADYLNKAQQVATGNLAGSTEPEIKTSGEVTELRIFILEYFDYVNKGVKGVKSSRNAPDSPYQYRNFGMNDEGRKSISDYIQSGRAKISNRSKPQIGLSTKRKSLLEIETDRLIYLIKAYGIKGSKYFDRAFDEAFKNIEKDFLPEIEKIVFGR